MRDDEIEVIQGVVVFGVSEAGTDLHVDIVGGDANVCGSIRFTFADPARRRRMRATLERWRRDRTPVTFVSTGSTVTLQNDRALFGQLEASA